MQFQIGRRLLYNVQTFWNLQFPSAINFKDISYILYLAILELCVVIEVGCDSAVNFYSK